MKKTLNRILSITLSAATIAAPNVNYAAYIPLSSSLKDYSYAGGDIDIQKMARIGLELQKYYVIDTGRYIPTSMPTYSNSEAQVAEKILKHTVQTMIDDDIIDFAVINQVQKLENSLSAELPVGKSTTNNGATSEDAGKFKLRFRPVSTEAQIRYEGRFGANLSYNIAEETTKLQISWTF